MRFFADSFKLLILSFLCISYLHAAVVSSDILPTHELIKALQSGGHIIYMRHGPTNHTQKDKDRHNLVDCSTQRNLSVQGRATVKKIGSIINTLKIPLGEVFSSPYCRCKESASLVFGEYKIEPKLQFSISKDKEESKMLGEQLLKMMMDTKNNRNNNVFVGHTSNLKDGLGIWPKPEGVIVVFQKRKNKIVYRGMIAPNDWIEF